MDEFGFIETLLAPLAGHPGALGLKDDAAVLDIPAGNQLVVSKDALIGGVHFIGDEPAHLIAQKLLRVNLSDLAAMGAEPYGYFLALMLPRDTPQSRLADFAHGLRLDQERYGLSLLGGDTTAGQGPLALSVTILGLVPQGAALLRSGAKAGDAIYVSGTLGDAALGLKAARLEPKDIQDELLRRYRLPEPRLALGQALRGLASACMDISDGLAQDMGHICRASHAGAAIEVSQLPVSPAARTALQGRPDFLETVLAGGDDYELLFTVPAQAQSEMLAAASRADISVTRIGMVEAGEGVAFYRDGRLIQLKAKGYRHF